MKKLKYSLFLIILFLFLFFENKVFALSINVEDDSNSKNTVSSEINMSKASWFSVTIPKKIVIDGSKKDIYTQNYEITVKGDLSGHETIYVIPEDNFKLKDITGLKEVTCNVSQSKNSFTIPSVGILDENTEGTVRTSNIEAGFYSGDFNFEIYKEIISNHIFGDWFTYLEPTCTEKGISRRVCSICNGYEEKDINALGHDWDSQKDENGYYIQRCKRNNSHIKNNGVVTYTISYTLNKGTISGQKTSYNVETDTFTIPTPTRSGYTFKGWSGTGLSGDTNKTVTVSKGSTGNKTYTANWTANTDTKYTVYHQQEQLDGTYKTVNTDSLTGTSDSKITPNTRSYTGFTAPSKQEIVISPEGTSSVTYKYSRNSYTVSVTKGIGISTVTGAKSYKYEQSVSIGYTLSNGYTFDSWTGDKTTSTFTMPASNVSMKANGKPISYTISYILNSGTISGQKTSYTIETDTFTIPTPTRSGYTFKGWSGTGLSGDTNKTVTVSKGSTGNKTYTANWIQNVNYKVIHQQEQLDGTYKEFETQTFTGPIGSKVKPAVKAYTGFNSPSTTEITITSDGKASVTYKYSRKTYTVTCEDWIVDASKNKKTNITSNIPLSTDSTYNNRTATVKYGTVINASAWGSQTGRSKYAPNYGYVGSNGNVTVTGNVTVYRYFHQTFDVNMTLDGTSNSTGKDGDKTIGTFDVYINGTLVSNDVCDYCALQPYGANVELKDFKANTGYKYKGNASMTGTMKDVTLVLAPAYVRTYEVTTLYSEGISKVTGAGYYEKGATVTLEATVYDCATWVNWTGNSTNTNKKFQFTMPASAVNYKANAKPNTSATTHNWKITVSQAATCETDSVESQVCTKCGHTKTTHNTKATGHIADKSKDVITKATCTKGGYTTHTCSKCGKTFVDTYTTATGHKYNSEGTCTVCGDFDINKLSPGTYTKVTENGKTRYTVNKSWDALISENILTVDSNGYVRIVGANTTTGASPNKDKIVGFVVLPTTVKKVDGASFYQCTQITGYYISKNVESFVDGWSNSKLGEFYVSPENTRFTVENGALYSKDKSILWCSAKAGTGAFNVSSSCKTIKSCAFARSGYSTINLPNGVTTLEGGSFRNMNNIKSITIPASLTTLNGAFPCSGNLATINVNSNNSKYVSVDGVVYTQDMKTLVACGAGKTGALNIPESVTRIENNSVDGCNKITSVEIPNTVTYIGDWAFSGCSSLTKITLPDNANYTEIRTGAFATIGVSEVIIPKNVKTIYRSNFRGKVTSLKFADTTKQWKLTLQDKNGTAVSGVPTGAFSVTNASQNATYFNKYIYYRWDRQ